MFLSHSASWSLSSFRRMILAGVGATASSSKFLSRYGTLLCLFSLTCGLSRFRDATQARDALEKMNGFDLAGRPIRVGLGNDKFTPESTANLLQRFQGQGQNQQFQGSAFSGAGGRGP